MKKQLFNLKSNSGIRKFKKLTKVLLLIFIFQSLGSLDKAVHAFGGNGPYDHLRITYEALDRFSQETGWEVNLYCAELIAQGSVVSDNLANGTNDILHCDNNDLAGCSYRLDQFKQEANRAISRSDSFMRMGQALHIVQDFYSHSNWVEIFEFTMARAPLEQFKDVPPPIDLQSGYFPDRFLDIDAQTACFFMPVDRWKTFIYGATHACLNKDSNSNQRGAYAGPYSANITLHELAAQYAINHSVELLKYYSIHNPNFGICFHKVNSIKGCNKAFVSNFR